MTYIWFWMSKTIAEIFLVAGFVGVVAAAVVGTALFMAIREKIRRRIG